MTNEQKIEALLFWKGEPMNLEKIGKILGITKEEVLASIEKLEENLSGRGVALLKKEDEFSLGTIPEASDMIEELTKEELSKDLGKAGLETLSIILYGGPTSRAMIDHVRGVNSSFILRNLTIRGLIEKIVNPNDSRAYLYKPSFELLSFLGIKKIEELPNFEESKNKIEEFLSGENKEKEEKDD